jgi:signal transduction histidine kinase
MIDLPQLVPAWPLVLSLAAAVAVGSLRSGRRRTALNEALHELRRPLQVVALASTTRTAAPGGEDDRGEGDPLEQAAAALERLDREINGGSPPAVWGVVDGGSLVRVAVGRWQARVRLADGSLQLRWSAGRATVSGDRVALSQALDNLIVNAIEHGGPTIVLSARVREGRLRIAVADSGRARRPRSRYGNPAEIVALLSGRRRHGHGLAVVQRVAAAHGGHFALRRSPQGSLAVLELPLLERDPQARPAA